jgi:hypothetical protein
MPKWQSSITLCELLQLCTAALQLMQQHHDSDVHAKMAIIHHTLWTAAAVHCCTAAEAAAAQLSCSAAVTIMPIIHCTLRTAAAMGCAALQLRQQRHN